MMLSTEAVHRLGLGSWFGFAFSPSRLSLKSAGM